MEQRKPVKRQYEAKESKDFTQRVQIPNETMKVKLTTLSRNNFGPYDREAALKIIESMPFADFSVPIYSYKNLLIDTEAHGHMVMGFITGYDAETETFDITVFGRYAAAVKGFNEPLVFPRVMVTPEKRIVIGALDVTPKAIHSKLYKLERQTSGK